MSLLEASWQRPTSRHKPQLPPAGVQQAVSRRLRTACRAANEGSASPSDTSLAATLQRKRDQLTAVLAELSEEQLLERLGGEELGQLSTQGGEHRFAGLIPEVGMREGRPVIVVELCKPSPGSSSAQLALLARELEAAGAEALAVPTDAHDTATGLADLLSVCRAVRCPVVRRDWILHPLQIREAKEAGAAAVMGIAASILGPQAVLLSSYGATLGLDCPVEVVNTAELEEMARMGAPFFGCNLGVGLALGGIPGARADVTRGLLAQLEQDAASVVGVTSLQEAREARAAGADMVLVKKEWLAKAAPQACGEREELPADGGGRAEPSPELTHLLRAVKYHLSGDD